MRTFLILCLLSVPFTSFCQITPIQQKALNSFVDYANQSAEEVTATVKSIITYYPTIHQKKSWGTPAIYLPCTVGRLLLEQCYQSNQVTASCDGGFGECKA